MIIHAKASEIGFAGVFARGLGAAGGEGYRALLHLWLARFPPWLL
jgi:hypothetical protein